MRDAGENVGSGSLGFWNDGGSIAGLHRPDDHENDPGQHGEKRPEHGQDARVSVLTGRTTAHKSSVSASKTYSVIREVIFEPKVFAELKNAQSIVLAYDGLNPHPPSYCYLKPYYLDPNTTYFEHLARGEI